MEVMTPGAPALVAWLQAHEKNVTPAASEVERIRAELDKLPAGNAWALPPKP